MYYYEFEDLLSTEEDLQIAISGISISPIPCDDVCSISCSEVLKIINIFDMNGKKIKSINPDYQSQIEINVSDLTNGMYIMTGIYQDNSSFTRKLIIFR